MAYTKQQQLIKEFFERPDIDGYIIPTLTAMADVLEQIESWELLWLDELTTQLGGSKTKSGSREQAIQRLKPLLETALGEKFPAPPTQPDPYQSRQPKGESPMLTQTNGKEKAVKSSKKKVVATKPKKTIAAVASKSLTSTGRGQFHDDMKITITAKENPHREGSTGAKMFDLVKKSKTVADYVAAIVKGKIGSRSRAIGDLRWRVEQKHLTVK